MQVTRTSERKTGSEVPINIKLAGLLSSSLRVYRRCSAVIPDTHINLRLCDRRLLK